VSSAQRRLDPAVQFLCLYLLFSVRLIFSAAAGLASDPAYPARPFSADPVACLCLFPCRTAFDLVIFVGQAFDSSADPVASCFVDLDFVVAAAVVAVA
jgi:hypothetical protein